MIDIHTHLIYNSDDGSKSIEETLYMLKEAYNVGFTDIILTPHYMTNYYIEDSTENAKKIDSIRDRLDNIKVILHQGNEIYANANLINLIKEKKVVPLAESKYILFELSMHENPFNLDEIVYSLLENGYVPIIAHPERYKYVQENPNMLIDYIERGVLFQSNYGSIIGRYGDNAKETIKKLLNSNMIHFLGTDNHRPNTIYNSMPEIIKVLNKVVGKDKVEELSTINPMKILKNEDFEVEEPILIKKKIWQFWK